MWTIYCKELRELMRDRKTLIFTILIPILALPLIFGGFGFFSTVLFKKAQESELRYAIFGKQYAPPLSLRIAQAKGFKEISLSSMDEIKQAIGDERIKFALVIPPEFQDNLSANKQGTIALHYNNAANLNVVARRVREVVSTHNGVLREAALSALNIDKQKLAFALNPIKIEEHSTANQREQIGAIAGGILPYILLTVCLMAAMYPAIDLGAGEKERGTLESLLLAPVSRSTVVLAKFSVLFSFGLTSALLMITSIALLLLAFGHSINADVGKLVASIGAADLGMLALMLVPTAAIFASLLLSISIYAKSFKEAQGFIQPLMLLVLLPIILAMLPGIELNWVWAMVPLTNVSLAMKELVKGTMDYRMFFVILFSTTIIAGGLLMMCRWWFSREEVLFRN